MNLIEQIVNQGLEIERLNKEVNNQRDEILAGDQDIERLTAELARAKQYHATELADVVAERDSLKSAVLGSKALIAELQSERVALKAALQLIKANTNTLDWPDDINAAIQGAGK